jgi:hypothetical protein
MLQAAAGSRFAAKSGAGGFVFYKPLVKDLNGDRSIDEQVAGAIDRAHSANPQTRLQAILLVEGVTHQRVTNRQIPYCGIRLQR